MIFIGIGSNLSSPHGGSPRANCHSAVEALNAAGLEVCLCSRWYRSAPVPTSDQPWFVNGVVGLEPEGKHPVPLMELLHQIELDFGRLRKTKNMARTLDLDIIDFDGRVATGGDGVILPHPRMHERAFVLLPLAEIAPDWRHPISAASIYDLIEEIPVEQYAEPIP
ncbi:MAG: 2-amino-4-hydroxy-6-hydroxymethyldihydropteridine diphosphokinase [Rhodospirillales bacterium]|nr:2-amino-4-hydroxy-6-hydroxymethyldihydropteridine diphosphokinase [Alphaproteobacteria bacterium]MBL6928293.1 2-amino-4-hydroxy-6-hydroxymethyldihydropteridine diphosphokinase [Rhodospirillales bacterium]